VVREIGVAQRMDERAVPCREGAWCAANGRQPSHSRPRTPAHAAVTKNETLKAMAGEAPRWEVHGMPCMTVPFIMSSALGRAMTDRSILPEGPLLPATLLVGTATTDHA
jgi:hypothetical protein